MRLVEDLVADHVRVGCVAGGDHRGERRVVALRARRLGRPERCLGLGLAALRRLVAAAGVEPGRHAARAAHALARLARGLGEVRRPVELVKVDQHVHVHAPIGRHLVVELPQHLGVPAVVAVHRRARLDGVPADVDAHEVRAHLRRDRSQVGLPDRDVEPAQDHRFSVLVDKLPTCRGHPRLGGTGGRRRMKRRRDGWHRRRACPGAARASGRTARGQQQGGRCGRRPPPAHRPNASTRSPARASPAWPSRERAPRSFSVALSRL